MATSTFPNKPTTGLSGTPDGLTMNVRRVNFDLPDPLPRLWFDESPWKTYLSTALSLTFPAAEQHFIIQGVKPFVREIQDPKLKEEVIRFIAQEHIHGKEHARLNEAIIKLYPFLGKMEKAESRIFGLASQLMGDDFRLAVSAALEHLTAIFGDHTLKHPTDFDGCEPTIRELFRWHAVEEIEHKSVAFDVNKAMGGSYLGRLMALFVGANLFAPIILSNVLYLASRDGVLFNLELFRDHQRQLKKMKAKGSPGMGRSFADAIPAFLHRDFHPWDDDNRHLIKGNDAYDPIATLKAQSTHFG